MTASQTFRNTLIVLLTLVAAYAVYQSIQILTVLVVALIIASSLRPLAMWLMRRRLSLGLSALLVYGLLALSLFTLSAIVIPPISSQLIGYLNPVDTAPSSVKPAVLTTPFTVMPFQSAGSKANLADQLIATQTWIEKQRTS